MGRGILLSAIAFVLKVFGLLPETHNNMPEILSVPLTVAQ